MLSGWMLECLAWDQLWPGGLINSAQDKLSWRKFRISWLESGQWWTLWTVGQTPASSSRSLETSDSGILSSVTNLKQDKWKVNTRVAHLIPSKLHKKNDKWSLAPDISQNQKYFITANTFLLSILLWWKLSPASAARWWTGVSTVCPVNLTTIPTTSRGCKSNQSKNNV